MPSVSKKQKRFMAAAAHNPRFAKKVGIKQSVAKEFNMADRLGKLKHKYAKGGMVHNALGPIKRLIAKHHSAIEMEDPQSATRIGRQLDSIKPGLAKASLEELNGGKKAVEALKLSTFAKGGMVRKALEHLDEASIHGELKKLNDDPAVMGQIDRRGSVQEIPGKEYPRRRYQELLDELRRRKGPIVKKARGGMVGSIENLTGRMEVLKKQAEKMKPGRDRDHVVDEYISVRQGLKKRTDKPKFLDEAQTDYVRKPKPRYEMEVKETAAEVAEKSKPKFAKGGDVKKAVASLRKTANQIAPGSAPAPKAPVTDRYNKTYDTAEKVKKGIADNYYGESDEPNWGDVHNLLKQLPGSGKARRILKQLEADTEGKTWDKLGPQMDAELRKLGVKGD